MIFFCRYTTETTTTKMKSRQAFLIVAVLSCSLAQVIGVASSSRHDDGTTEGLVSPSPTTQQSSSNPTPQIQLFTSSVPEDGNGRDNFKPSPSYARVISENHYNDAPKYTRLNPNTTANVNQADGSSQFLFPGRKLEVGDSPTILTQAPTIIQLFDGVRKPEEKEVRANKPSVSSTSTVNVVKFSDTEEENIGSVPPGEKKAPRLYYGEVASKHVYSHSPQGSQSQSSSNTQQSNHQHHQIQPQRPHHHVTQAHDTQQSHTEHHGHGVGHGHSYASIPHLPDSVNEVSYPVQKEEYHYDHGHVQEEYYAKPVIGHTSGKHVQDEYYSKPAIGHTSGKHVQAEVNIGVPAVHHHR